MEDGGRGSISASIQVPYRTANAEGITSVEFAQVGISGSIKADVAGPRENGVKLEIQDLTISNLLGISGGAPLMSSRSLRTTLFVRNGLSAAVGGVVSSSNSSGYNQAPAGAKTSGDPLINLLASKEFNKKQNQFVVFITPNIRSSASTGVDEIKKKFRVH